jgi:hypothetical protein
MEDNLSIDIKIKRGLYRHYKGGEYIVLGQGFHSETQEHLVFYMSVNDGKMWARPLKMFMEQVFVNDMIISRFHLVKSYE